MIRIGIDLSRYMPSEIIDFHKNGLVTMEEIIHSGRQNTEFGSELKNYIRDHVDAEYLSRMRDLGTTKEHIR